MRCGFSALSCQLRPNCNATENMASLLGLNDDCLQRIVSYLDDPRSFYSISLTCKRLLQVTKLTRNVIHSKLLRSKAEYYIKIYLVHICDTTWKADLFDKYCKLRDLLRGSSHLIAAKGILTYAKVIDVWQKNGPVVAKLFTWIRNQETDEEDSESEDSEYEVWGLRPTCITTSVTFHLPSCDKNMVINTRYFEDYIRERCHGLSIHVTCGDVDVTSDGKL